MGPTDRTPRAHMAPALWHHVLIARCPLFAVVTSPSSAQVTLAQVWAQYMLVALGFAGRHFLLFLARPHGPLDVLVL